MYRYRGLLDLTPYTFQHSPMPDLCLLLAWPHMATIRQLGALGDCVVQEAHRSGRSVATAPVCSGSEVPWWKRPRWVGLGQSRHCSGKMVINTLIFRGPDVGAASGSAAFLSQYFWAYRWDICISPDADTYKAFVFDTQTLCMCVFKGDVNPRKMKVYLQDYPQISRYSPVVLCLRSIFLESPCFSSQLLTQGASS